MKETPSPEDFNTLPLPKKEAGTLAPNRYRIYSDSKKYVVIEAENARTALLASGIKQAHHIEREGLYIANVIQLSASIPPAAVAKDTETAAPATGEDAAKEVKG